MYGSCSSWFKQLARRDSSLGGGAATAACAAMAAALLQKLASPRSQQRALAGIRASCLRLGRQDGDAFARAVRLRRAGHTRAFRRALKQAIEVPYRVLVHTHTLETMCRRTRRTVAPQWASDLACAQALARASGRSARGFIRANLAWLGDPAHAAEVRRRLRRASRTHARRR